MPRNPSTGVFTRVSNSFSEPVIGTIIDPSDADQYYDDQDLGLTESLSRTGEGAMQADLDMATHNINNLGTVVGGTFSSAAINRVLNVLSYGVVGNGITNDAVALGLAATAISVAGGTLVFPPGKIRSNSSITINIPAGGSVILEGYSTLYFPASHGLIINYGDKYSSFHVNGLTLTTGTAGTYHAFRLIKTATDANPALSGATSLTDITVRGDDGFAVAFYWDTGTYVSNVPNINWTRYNAIGVGGTLGTGIYVEGKVSATSYAIGFGIHQSVFETLGTGILVGSYIQGVNVDSMTLFTGTQVGIHTAVGTLGDLEYLSVCGSQFDDSAAAIFMETVVGEVLISNNLIFTHASNYGILGAMANFAISGNTFQGGAASSNIAIEITSGGIGAIGANAFSGLATAIKLDAPVTLVNVLGTNAYSSVTTKVNNLGGSTNTVILFPGGTTDFTATGGTGQFVKQASSGAPFTVAAVPVSEVSGFGTGVATFLATPSSSNLRSALTDESGTGSAVFATSPTITTPNIVGTATNNDAAAGSVGEYVSGTASAVSLVNSTAKTVTSMSLTAGDWDIECTLRFNAAATTQLGNTVVSVSQTNNTLDLAVGNASETLGFSGIPGTGFTVTTTSPTVRKSLASTTTIYCVAYAVFGVDTLTADGLIRARRVR